MTRLGKRRRHFSVLQLWSASMLGLCTAVQLIRDTHIMLSEDPPVIDQNVTLRCEAVSYAGSGAPTMFPLFLYLDGKLMTTVVENRYCCCSKGHDMNDAWIVEARIIIDFSHQNSFVECVYKTQGVNQTVANFVLHIVRFTDPFITGNHEALVDTKTEVTCVVEEVTCEAEEEFAVRWWSRKRGNISKEVSTTSVPVVTSHPGFQLRKVTSILTLVPELRNFPTENLYCDVTLTHRHVTKSTSFQINVFYLSNPKISLRNTTAYVGEREMWTCTVAEFSIVNDYDGWIDWTFGNGTHLPHEHQDIVPQKTALSNSTMSLFNFTSQLQLILTEPDTDFTLVCEIGHRLHEVISKSSLPFNVKVKAKATNYSHVTTANVSGLTNSTRQALLQVGKSRQLPGSGHRTLKGLFSTVSMHVLMAVVGIVDAACLVIVIVVRRNAMSLTAELDEVILRADKKLGNLRGGKAPQRQTSNIKGMSKTESSASLPASAVSSAESAETSTTAGIY